jgi:hypothetical protein
MRRRGAFSLYWDSNAFALSLGARHTYLKFPKAFALSVCDFNHQKIFYLLDFSSATRLFS